MNRIGKIINIDIPPKLTKFVNSKSRYNVMYGGRGGGKSWTIALILLINALRRKSLVLCTREVQNTIRDSVHRLLVNTIHRYGWDGLFDIGKQEIKCLRNDSLFIFKGLSRNISEIKSTEGIDHCWIEEAHRTSRESLDVLIPTIRKDDSQFWIGYNPDNINDPVHQDFVVNTHPAALVENINYYDNPDFPEVLKKEMEYDKEYNYDKYLHVWEGQIKEITDACVFKDKFTVQNYGTPQGVEFYYGADWGFSNDPTCLVRCYVKDDILYIDHEAYGVGVELDEIEQLFDSVPGVRKHKIVGDSSRPDTISYLNRKGFVIRSSKKGAGSIEDGIEFIKSHKRIVIHERCKNAIYEFKSYSYKKDKHTDEILPILVDKNNHMIDGLRYSLEGLRKGISKVKMSEVSANSLGL